MQLSYTSVHILDLFGYRLNNIIIPAGTSFVHHSYKQ